MKYVQLIQVNHEYGKELAEGDLHDYISYLPNLALCSSKLLYLGSEVSQHIGRNAPRNFSGISDWYV